MGHVCPQLPIVTLQERLGQAVGVHSTLHAEHADWQPREKIGLHVVEGVPELPHPDSLSVTASIVPVVAEHHDAVW